MVILSDCLARLGAWPGDGSLEEASLGLSRSETANLQWNGLIRLDRGPTTVRRVARSLAESAIPALVEQALGDLDARFPTEKPLRVDVWPMDPDDAFGHHELRGISAATGYDGHMSLVVSPDTSRAVVRETVIHEFHHHLRMDRGGLREEAETLLTRLVLEGMAEHFVAEMVGQSTAPWVAPVPSRWTALWPAFLPHLSAPGCSPLAVRLLFGDPEAGLPRWAGYTVGYLLVERYRQAHPALSVADLSALADAVFVP